MCKTVLCPLSLSLHLFGDLPVFTFGSIIFWSEKYKLDEVPRSGESRSKVTRVLLVCRSLKQRGEKKLCQRHARPQSNSHTLPPLCVELSSVVCVSTKEAVARRWATTWDSKAWLRVFFRFNEPDGFFTSSWKTSQRLRAPFMGPE